MKFIIYYIIIDAGLGGFVACRALSQRNDDPMKASRPWDMVIQQSTCPPPLFSLKRKPISFNSYVIIGGKLLILNMIVFKPVEE